MATPAERVAPPRRVPRKGGLKSVTGDWRTNERLGRAGTLQYDADVCSPVVGSVQLCYGPDLNLGTDEVQTVTITGTPTGGTFRLTFDGLQTGTIAYNATAATVRTALEALDNIDVGEVAVTGGPGPGTPYVVTFSGGDLQGRDLPQMTATHAFTGGTAPNIAVTTTTPGVAPKTAGLGFPSGAPVIDVFGGYLGVECFIHPDNEYEARARQALELAESRFVEARLFAWLNAASNTNAANLGAAIAAAENHADTNYIARPVLHMNRGDAVTAGVLSPNPVDDGKLWTPNGTPVVASSAYTAGIVTVSGDITVENSGIKSVLSDALRTNKRMAIAERIYGLLVDCDYRAKFTVSP